MVNFRTASLHPREKGGGGNSRDKQSYLTKLVLTRFLGYLPNIWRPFFLKFNKKFFLIHPSEQYWVTLPVNWLQCTLQEPIFQKKSLISMLWPRRWRSPQNVNTLAVIIPISMQIAKQSNSRLMLVKEHDWWSHKTKTCAKWLKACHLRNVGRIYKTY